MRITAFIKALLPISWRAGLADALACRLGRYATRSYAQEGEDVVLSRIIGPRRAGFYVDVGACHPQRYSNTYLFYRRGWRGINIDARPGSMAAFQRQRRRDISLELAVAEAAGELTCFLFDEPALNTCDSELAMRRQAETPYHLLRQVQVPAYPLAEILERHLPAGQAIDFLSIDVEGLDLSVLRSNDWARFRPAYLVVECVDMDAATLAQSPLHAHVSALGYRLLAKTLNTAIYGEAAHA